MSRIDPNPDPFARQATPLVRNPGRQDAKQVVVDSTRPAPRMRAHVRCPSGSIAIVTATDTFLLFDVVDFDSVGLWSVTTNRFTIPTTGRVTGPWLIHGQAKWAGSVAGTFRKLWIRRNGSTAIRSTWFSPVANPQSLNVTALIDDPTPGDYFELMVRHDAGVNVDVLKAPDETYFSIIHLW